MDIFPLNLVLAVAVASATIFFGFLPTRNISSSFFAQETLKAAVLWLAVAFIAPPAILHYYFFLAILCFGAWWKFQHDHAFSGKMWLSLASGLGISVGVMFLLAVTPRAYPPGLSQTGHALLLASIYLGGAVIGLAYVSHALIRGSVTQTGLTNDLIRHYIRLLLILVLARAIVLVISACILPTMAFRPGMHSMSEAANHALIRQLFLMHSFGEFKGAIGLSGIVLPCLAFWVWRAICSGHRVLASRILAAICLGGLAVETFIRFHLG